MAESGLLRDFTRGVEALEQLTSPLREGTEVIRRATIDPIYNTASAALEYLTGQQFPTSQEAFPSRMPPRVQEGLLASNYLDEQGGMPSPDSAVQQFMDRARAEGGPQKYVYDEQGNLVPAQQGLLAANWLNAQGEMPDAVEAIRKGADAAKIQKENQQTESLLGGIFDNPIVKQLIAGFAAPEFLASQYGLGGRSPVAALVGGMQANQAREIARTKEAAKLQEEMRIQQVKEAQKAEELAINRIRAERETVRPATVTGPKVEAYMRYLKGNKTLAKEVNKIAKEGNYIFTTEKEREDVRNALALEAINIQNANPRLTMQQAFNQALGIMRGGKLSTTQSQKPSKFGQARIK